MTKRRRRLSIVIALFVIAIYATAVVVNMEEKNRRSLQLTDEATAADRVRISIAVTSVNPASRQMTAQLGFLPFGALAKDIVIPRTDLKLLVNNIQGQHEFVFPAGERMHRIEVTFPLDGDVNRYPFDKYDATIRLFMETSRPIKETTSIRTSQAPNEPAEEPQDQAEMQQQSEVLPNLDEMVVEATALQSNAGIPLSISLSASIPQIKLKGEVTRNGHSKIPLIKLHVSRPENVINLSIVVMIMMMALAGAILAMTIKGAIRTGRFDPLPISLAVALIFGLPALRGIQAGIPPVGVLGDYFSFFWAELFVAAAAIIAAITWLIRSELDTTAD